MKRIGFMHLLLLLAAFITGCICWKDDGLPRLKTEVENGRKVITLPDGRRFKNTHTTENPIEERFSWGVRTGEQGKHIGYGRGGERIYETEEEYCLYGWTPESSGAWYFDETFVFPDPKAEEFGKVTLYNNEKETILENETCIQAFLDRLMTRKYDINGDYVEELKGYATVRFYSREYPKLSFLFFIYQDKDKEKYYIEARSNWIDCTDIIEQYLSEYFK